MTVIYILALIGAVTVVRRCWQMVDAWRWRKRINGRWFPPIGAPHI